MFTSSNSSALGRVVNAALPAISGSALTYNAATNTYLTQGYTSAAGNTYYQGIRLSDRLIVSYELGQGYAHTFLNGIRIFGFNGKQTRLLGSRAYDCFFFNEANAKEQCVEIVSDYLASQARMMGATLPQQQTRHFATALINDVTTKKQQQLSYC